MVTYRDLATVDLNRSIAQQTYVKTRDEDAGIDVSITWELTSRPQQSNNAAIRGFNSSYTFFNGDWFEGNLTFQFEAQVKNSSGVNPYTVTIWNGVTAAVIGTVTVPANTNPAGGTSSVWIQGTTFVPAGGADTLLQVVLPQTTNNNELQEWRVRIRISGRMIRGRLQIPMLGIGGGISQQDLVSGDNRLQLGNGSTGLLAESTSNIFFKEAGAWATVDHWAWESVGGNTGTFGDGTPSFTVALAPIGTTNVVVQNVHLTPNNGSGAILTDFADAAPFFVDGGEFGVITSETIAGGGVLPASNSILYKVCLYVQISDLRKATVFSCVFPSARNPIPEAGFSDVVDFGHEVVATETAPGTDARILTTSVGPSTTDAEVTVPGSNLNPAGAKARYRVVGLPLPVGSLYYNSSATGGTGSVSVFSEFALIFLEK